MVHKEVTWLFINEGSYFRLSIWILDSIFISDANFRNHLSMAIDKLAHRWGSFMAVSPIAKQLWKFTMGKQA